MLFVQLPQKSHLKTKEVASLSISISMRACQEFSVIRVYWVCANKLILAHSHFWLLGCDPGDPAVQLLHMPVLSCSKQTLCCGCSYFITTLGKLEWVYLTHKPGHTLSTCRYYTQTSFVWCMGYMHIIPVNSKYTTLVKKEWDTLTTIKFCASDVFSSANGTMPTLSFGKLEGGL